MSTTVTHPRYTMLGEFHRLKDIAVGGSLWRHRRSVPAEGDLTAHDALMRVKKAAARIHEQAHARFAEIGYQPNAEDEMFLQALRRIRLLALGGLHLRDELLVQ